MLGIGGRTLLRSGDARAAVYAARSASGEPASWPPLDRRVLGRTGFEGSRLVFGCGAALSRTRRDELLGAAFDAGINVFDVGFRGYYRDAEANLAPFLKTRRDQVFLISKAMPDLDVKANDEISARPGQGGRVELEHPPRPEPGRARRRVGRRLLRDGCTQPPGGPERGDPGGFDRARQAGKVRHLGLSTHENAQKVLAAAKETGRYDLAQIAITPAGWYDWEDKGILPGSPAMTGLRPFLDELRPRAWDSSE